MGDNGRRYPDVPGHAAGSETSEAAARSMDDHAQSLCQKVYVTLHQAGDNGHTDDEVEVLMGLSHQTVSARRRELVLRGLVHDSGQRRRTRRKRLATVWKVTKPSILVPPHGKTRITNGPSREEIQRRRTDEAPHAIERLRVLHGQGRLDPVAFSYGPYGTFVAVFSVATQWWEYGWVDHTKRASFTQKSTTSPLN